MFRSYFFRLINSFEFFGIMVLIAVVLTTEAFSVKVERDPSIKQQSLTYSHLATVQKPQQPNVRGAK
jgi:hypothetical protein